MEDWQKRVIKEYKELVTKIDKLDRFLYSNDPDRLESYDLLCAQLYTMQTYATILKARIKLFTGNKNLEDLIK